MSRTHLTRRADDRSSQAVLRMLHDAHERLREEFDEFERLDRLEAPSAPLACQRVAQRTFAELKVIADVERGILYPALSDALAGTDLIEQSEIEHTCIGRLVEALEVAAPARLEYRKGFRVLGEHVRRHIDDEEQELFPALPGAAIDWDALYRRMRERRTELAEELGIADFDAHAPARRRADDEPEFDADHAIDDGVDHPTEPHAEPAPERTREAMPERASEHTPERAHALAEV